jgi:hypothetical protein
MVPATTIIITKESITEDFVVVLLAIGLAM